MARRDVYHQVRAVKKSVEDITIDVTAMATSLNEIKNKAGITGYDRTTDSLEALGEKTALIPGLF